MLSVHARTKLQLVQCNSNSYMNSVLYLMAGLFFKQFYFSHCQLLAARKDERQPLIQYNLELQKVFIFVIFFVKYVFASENGKNTNKIEIYYYLHCFSRSKSPVAALTYLPAFCKNSHLKCSSSYSRSGDFMEKKFGGSF